MSRRRRCSATLPGWRWAVERLIRCASGFAEGLTGLDVAPSRDAIARRSEAMATGRVRRPVVVLGSMGRTCPRPER